MTNRKRRTRSQSGALDQFQIQELKTGQWCLLSGTGYQFNDHGMGDAPGIEGMRRDWAKHGQGITADWIERHPGTRPWAWWEFSAPEPKPETETEYQYLARLNLLTPMEREA